MADYSYVFYSLRNEQVIAEIPCFGANFAQRINEAQQGTVTFQLDQTGKDNADLIEATIPGRTGLAVERNGVVIWSGVVWSRTYQSQSKTCQLNLWTYEVFPAKQRILSDVTYTGDPLNIFFQLWRDMQGVAGRNMSINVPVNVATVSTTDITIHGYEVKFYGEIMQDLSDAQGAGFDWTIDVLRTSGTSQYVKTLRAGRPTLGSLQSTGSLVFEYPGAITNYFETESMAETGTHIIVLGAGESESMLTAEVNYTAMIDLEGWPRWDEAVSRKDINNQSILSDIAAQQGIIHKAPGSVIKATVKANLDPVFGSYGLGDYCTLVISDPKHPTPLQLATRIIGWEIHPQSSEESETVALAFAMELD